MSVTALRSAAEVLVATGHDPYARSSLRHSDVRGWVVAGATAWVGVNPERGVVHVSSLGGCAQVGDLLGRLLPELRPRQRVTVPRGTPVHLPAWVGLGGAGQGRTDWDFRYVTAPPPEQHGEDRVEPTSDGPAVTALLAAASPTASVLPGHPSVRRWVGVRDAGGALVACAADTSSATGVGHLSSIAVAAGARGDGLGKAVTASLTRSLLADGMDLVTLGMYADNAAGKALYDALGFVDEHRFSSGPLLVRGRW